MNGKAAKDHRRTANAGASKAVQAVAPAIQAVAQNEKLTRDRVDALEAFQGRNLRGRLRWLLRGK